jgi:hypothetical protein
VRALAVALLSLLVVAPGPRRLTEANVLLLGPADDATDAKEALASWWRARARTDEPVLLAGEAPRLLSAEALGIEGAGDVAVVLGACAASADDALLAILQARSPGSHLAHAYWPGPRPPCPSLAGVWTRASVTAAPGADGQLEATVLENSEAAGRQAYVVVHRRDPTGITRTAAVVDSAKRADELNMAGCRASVTHDGPVLVVDWRCERREKGCTITRDASTRLVATTTGVRPNESAEAPVRRCPGTAR